MEFNNSVAIFGVKAKKKNTCMGDVGSNKFTMDFATQFTSAAMLATKKHDGLTFRRAIVTKLATEINFLVIFSIKRKKHK